MDVGRRDGDVERVQGLFPGWAQRTLPFLWVQDLNGEANALEGGLPVGEVPMGFGGPTDAGFHGLDLVRRAHDLVDLTIELDDDTKSAQVFNHSLMIARHFAPQVSWNSRNRSSASSTVAPDRPA